MLPFQPNVFLRHLGMNCLDYPDELADQGSVGSGPGRKNMNRAPGSPFSHQKRRLDETAQRTMAENQTAALANFEQAAAPPSPPGSEKSSSAGETVAALDLGADLGAGAAAKDVDAGTMDATVDPDEATGHNSTRALVFVLISIALSLFLGSLDMTVVATALPTVCFIYLWRSYVL